MVFEWLDSECKLEKIDVLNLTRCIIISAPGTCIGRLRTHTHTHAHSGMTDFIGRFHFILGLRASLSTLTVEWIRFEMLNQWVRVFFLRNGQYFIILELVDIFTLLHAPIAKSLNKNLTKNVIEKLPSMTLIFLFEHSIDGVMGQCGTVAVAISHDLFYAKSRTCADIWVRWTMYRM